MPELLLLRLPPELDELRAGEGLDTLPELTRDPPLLLETEGRLLLLLLRLLLEPDELLLLLETAGRLVVVPLLPLEADELLLLRTVGRLLLEEERGDGELETFGVLLFCPDEPDTLPEEVFERRGTGAL